MAAIKPIENASVHRIQSGQVIVDLCSVVKELVENSLDAGATSVEVRFKNQGLDAIEVADNGSGIAKEDYESVALKHYTSKLRNYDDLTELDTFGFRGEALSSLCALSDVHIITAQEQEAPKATRLNFAISGALKDTSTVAAQRGTTVYVETIFKNLPVRRQELTKNIKREYNKVLNLLQAYACISTTSRLIVSNLAAKGKKTIVFATKAKQTTRENIANVFGTKTTAALIPLELQFKLQGSTYDASDSQVRVSGHVSRPTVGEGRQMADRQMFFVNGRSCALPQVAKVINEVYRSYNLNQSPFIFANMELDTNAYDVNVSPDKRTILLHEQGALLESLKTSLLELFESHQQSVPQAMQEQSVKIPSAFKRVNDRKTTAPEPENVVAGASQTETLAEGLRSRFASGSESIGENDDMAQKLFSHKVQSGKINSSSMDVNATAATQPSVKLAGVTVDEPPNQLDRAALPELSETRQDEDLFVSENEDTSTNIEESQNFKGDRSAKDKMFAFRGSQGSQAEIPSVHTTPVKEHPGSIPSAFERMRPLRAPVQQATITIGDQTTTRIIGGSSGSKWNFGVGGTKSKVKSRTRRDKAGNPSFQSSLKAFAAPGTQQISENENDEEDTVSENGASEVSDTDPPADNEVSGNSAIHIENNGGDEHESSRADSEVPAHQVESGDEYLDDEKKKEQEDARVAQLIRNAEKQTAKPTDADLKRVGGLLKGTQHHSTTKLQLNIAISEDEIMKRADIEREATIARTKTNSGQSERPGLDVTAEERLTLAVSKEDFAAMRIAGQFNLGFIVASRPSSSTDKGKSDDELFIIDQHASDEKYNFERLQATTTVQNQALVNSQRLDLTAVEEELILENQDTLLQNGFEIHVDESGEYPVGKRCTLVSLPMSKEVTFSTRDLEELLALLAESPAGPSQSLYQQQQKQQENSSSVATNTPKLSRESTFSNTVVRPSSVRKMFAMRACRSSVMIGKTLNHKQMRGLVDNMGKMDKPWNCPHGRPTMRHLYSFGQWKGWQEGDGVAGMTGDKLFQRSDNEKGKEIDWKGWLSQQVDGPEESGESESDDESDRNSSEMDEDITAEQGMKYDDESVNDK